MDDLSQYADPLTIEVLKRVLPSNELQPKLTSIKWSTEIVVSIELPAPLGAEYSFSIYLLPEKQIHAELVGVESVSSKDFWYMPFEDAAFNNSVEKLDRAFASTLELVLSHETRIVQKHGFLFESFVCEYKQVDRWKRVYRMGGLRIGGFKAPRINGRIHTYHSPPPAIPASPEG